MKMGMVTLMVTVAWIVSVPSMVSEPLMEIETKTVMVPETVPVMVPHQTKRLQISSAAQVALPTRNW